MKAFLKTAAALAVLGFTTMACQPQEEHKERKEERKEERTDKNGKHSETDQKMNETKK